MNDVLFRKAEKKDIVQIAMLVTNLLGTCNLDTNKSILDNNIKEISDEIDNYYVCEKNGKVIGACGLSDVKERDNYNLGLSDIKETLYLVVDKDNQGQGLGTKLLEICCRGQENDIICEAWGDNSKYVNSKFVLERYGFELYKDLGNDYYRKHNYCSMCVNRNKNCNSCLAQIWIKKAKRR